MTAFSRPSGTLPSVQFRTLAAGALLAPGWAGGAVIAPRLQGALCASSAAPLRAMAAQGRGKRGDAKLTYPLQNLQGAAGLSATPGGELVCSKPQCSPI